LSQIGSSADENVQIRKGYRNASNYDRLRFSSSQGRSLDKIEKAAFIRLIRKADNPSPLLDLGCGTGRFIALGLSMGMSVVGADLSLPMLNIAKKRIADRSKLMGLVLCDAVALPFRRGSFGCIDMIRLFGLIRPEFRRRLLRELYLTTNRFVLFNAGNVLSLIVFIIVARQVRRQVADYYTVLWKLRKELWCAGFSIVHQLGPLVIPPTRFPGSLTLAIERMNSLFSGAFLKHFSIQQFLLAQKCTDL
jgi:SAM-dependent methyltransferase